MTFLTSKYQFNRFIRYVVFVLFGITSLLAGCAKTTVPLNVTKAATSSDAAKIKRIAVMPFNGQAGSTVAAKLEAQLSKVNIQNKPFFQVSSGQHRARSAGVSRSNRVTGFDKDGAIRLGKMLRVDGVYGGDVTTYKIDTKRYNEQRTRCSSYKQGKNKFFRKCNNWSRYTVSCIKREATVSIAPRLISVSSGRIVYSSTKTGSDSSANCSDGRGGKSESELLTAALSSAISQIRNDVAPRTETLQVDVMTEPKSLNGKNRKRFTQAVAFLESGDESRACRIWEEIDMAGAKDAYLSYNLAICDERSGNIQAAADKIYAAKERLNMPDKNLINAHKRYQRMLNEKNKVASQIH